ncbi:MAG: sugar phosphate isomerase/epimerase [Gemmataceae bacterium]|nr:sugar phosphate isomerase/epimerase [Gemmataceae bacterium]
MKLAFSTNAYLRVPFADAVRRIASIGYSGVEIMADVPHAWPAYILPEQVFALRQAVDNNGLEISNVNAFMMHAVNDPRQKYWHPSWIEPDPHYRRLRVRHTIAALELAKMLGAPCITTEPGGPLEPGTSWQVGLDLFVEELKPVIEKADNLGILLLIEPEPDLLIETAEQFEELMTRIESPAVALNFDVGHFYCVGDDPPATLHRLRRFIRHIHLEDIAGTRVHAHMIPGDGAIDLPATLAAIREIDYRGWVTIELYPYAADPDMAAKTAYDRVQGMLDAPCPDGKMG